MKKPIVKPAATQHEEKTSKVLVLFSQLQFVLNGALRAELLSMVKFSAIWIRAPRCSCLRANDSERRQKETASEKHLLSGDHIKGWVKSMPNTISINTASTQELTQLPGISKTVAYRLVHHGKRHGYFTYWQELLELKEFPPAALSPYSGAGNALPNPRRFGRGASALPPERRPSRKKAKKPTGYTKSIRGTRSQDRLKPSAWPGCIWLTARAFLVLPSPVPI